MRWRMCLGGIATIGLLVVGAAPAPAEALTEGTSIPLTGVAQVAVGQLHACAAMVDGTVRCWGWNAYGELGDGSTSDSSLAVTVEDEAGDPLDGVVQVAVGIWQSC